MGRKEREIGIYVRRKKRERERETTRDTLQGWKGGVDPINRRMLKVSSHF